MAGGYVKGRANKVNNARTSKEGMHAFATAVEFLRLVSAERGGLRFKSKVTLWFELSTDKFGSYDFWYSPSGGWMMREGISSSSVLFGPRRTQPRAAVGVADPVKFMQFFLRNNRGVVNAVEAEIGKEAMMVWTPNQDGRKLAAGLHIASALQNAVVNPRFKYARRKLRREFADLSANRTENVTRPLARNLARRAIAKAVDANNRRQAARPRRPPPRPERPAYVMWGPA